MEYGIIKISAIQKGEKTCYASASPPAERFVHDYKAGWDAVSGQAIVEAFENAAVAASVIGEWGNK